ncbi:MAG: cobalamin-binding protein [Longimicrobiales bacterium]
MRRLLPALIAAALLTACSRDESPRTTAAPHSDSVSVTDDVGTVVTLAAPAQRVISMIPAQTEIVKILGGTGRLVARTQWDKDPDLAHLPSTGNALSPSVEWLVAQHPDLVIAWPDNDARNVINQLRPLGIPVYSSRVESVAEITSMIRRLGTLLGEDARADSLARTLNAQLDSVRAAVAGETRPTVLYALSIDPPMAAGVNTFVGALIDAAGGRTLFEELDALWPQVSLEEIVRRQPDVILLPVGESTSGSAAALRTRPGWRDLKAVKNNRVYEVDADLFHRPGATLGRAARMTARLLHPGAAHGLRADSAAAAPRSAPAVTRRDSAGR